MFLIDSTLTYKEAAVADTQAANLELIPDQDERELAKLGYKPQLKRNFAFLSMLGFSSSIMVTWEGLFSTFLFGLNNGGPGGLVYGFVFCWLGYAAVVASMGELASIMPTAGGQYVWTYTLAPPKWRKFLSYITGWQSVIAWQACTATGGYLTATVIQGLAILSHPSYNPQRWHGTLIVFAIMALCLLFNSFLARHLPKIEYAILILHLAGYVIVLTCITVLAPVKSSASEVFTSFINGGNYETMGLSFFIGLTATVFAFIGADGAIHMCEEIKNASTVVPNAMVGSIAINGFLGFTMLLAMLFCIGDIDAAINSPTGYPFIEILTQATRSVAGGTGLCSVLISLFVCATIAIVAATSRQLWAFARDRGVPGSRIVSYVEPRTKLPLPAIGITVLITCLLSLINIGSPAAFNAIVSLVVAGFLASYILPFGLLLYRRIADPASVEWGPWRMGKFGIFVNAFAITWSLIAMFFSFWPSTLPVTAQNMNWSALLYGATVLFSLAFYILHGRHIWNGPVREIAVLEAMT